jgi:hypothetical protein
LIISCPKGASSMIIQIKSFTHIFIVDEHGSFKDTIAMEFHDRSKYEIQTFSSYKEFLESLKGYKHKPAMNFIVILGIQLNGDNKERIQNTKEKLIEIQESFPQLEIIVIVPPDDQPYENELISIGAGTIVIRNDNAFLRITNYIRGFLSKKNLERERISTRRIYKLFFGIILLVSAIVFFLILFFPENFSL